MKQTKSILKTTDTSFLCCAVDNEVGSDVDPDSVGSPIAVLSVQVELFNLASISLQDEVRVQEHDSAEPCVEWR